MRRLVLALASTLLLATACDGAASPTASGSSPGGPASTVGPTATAPPHPAPTTGVWESRYLLLDRYPDFAFCDPDFYPVAREDEQAAADDWWSDANPGSPEVRAILAHHGYRVPLTTPQRLTAYRDHKKLTVIAMTAVAGGYDYELSTSRSAGGDPDQTVRGVISFDGVIRELSRRARPGGCPICLEADTRIATPRGDVRVAELRPGDVLWTVDTSGARIGALVDRVVSRATPGPHLMLRLELADARVLVAAGAHPAASGGYLRALRPGQRYDGTTVASVRWVLSTAAATYDIVPAGPSGDYWANGILIGSTLTGR